MSRRGDREFLHDILEACNRIIDFTKDISYDEFVEDIKHRMLYYETLR